MTHKQSIFVEEYLKDMNATQAAIRAGYSKRTAGAIGAENLRKPEIKQAIEAAMNERKNNLSATREQRKEFWTQIMNDESADLKHRLRASELLAKSEGDFDLSVIERERKKGMTIEDKIQEMTFF